MSRRGSGHDLTDVLPCSVRCGAVRCGAVRCGAVAFLAEVPILERVLCCLFEEGIGLGRGMWEIGGVG